MIIFILEIDERKKPAVLTKDHQGDKEHVHNAQMKKILTDS